MALRLHQHRKHRPQRWRDNRTVMQQVIEHQNTILMTLELIRAERTHNQRQQRRLNQRKHIGLLCHEIQDFVDAGHARLHAEKGLVVVAGIDSCGVSEAGPHGDETLDGYEDGCK